MTQDETLAKANAWLMRGQEKYLASKAAYEAAHREEDIAERDAWFAARRKARQERANATRILQIA